MRYYFLLLLASLAGCASANPRTKFSGNPWTGTFSFFDSKDNDVRIEGLNVDLSTKQAECELLTLTNNASEVRRANVEQMLAFVEQQKAFNEGLAHVTDMLGQVAGILGQTVRGSAVEVNTPIGAGHARIGPAATQPAEPPR